MHELCLRVVHPCCVRTNKPFAFLDSEHESSKKRKPQKLSLACLYDTFFETCLPFVLPGCCWFSHFIASSLHCHHRQRTTPKPDWWRDRLGSERSKTSCKGQIIGTTELWKCEREKKRGKVQKKQRKQRKGREIWVLWDAAWSWCLDMVLQPNPRSGWIQMWFHLSVSFITSLVFRDPFWIFLNRVTEPPYDLICGPQIYSIRPKKEKVEVSHH